jgi:hypothetical protein
MIAHITHAAIFLGGLVLGSGLTAIIIQMQARRKSHQLIMQAITEADAEWWRKERERRELMELAHHDSEVFLQSTLHKPRLKWRNL